MKYQHDPELEVHLFNHLRSFSEKSKTKNEEFESKGYLVLRNFLDVEDYISTDIPEDRGHFRYRNNKCELVSPVEGQVEGSLSIYTHPKYKKLYFDAKSKLEKILSDKLYPTYYYERYYFPGQDLKIHVDRPSCEISLSLHLSTNLKEEWPFWIRDTSEKDISVNLNPGDVILYKGCERPHWRWEMPGKRKFFQRKDLYYHHIFFHYVLSNGMYTHHANDALI